MRVYLKTPTIRKTKLDQSMRMTTVDSMRQPEDRTPFVVCSAYSIVPIDFQGLTQTGFKMKLDLETNAVPSILRLTFTKALGKKYYSSNSPNYSAP